MTIRRHIAAYTEAGSNYPAYISINQEVNSGDITITVRSRGNGGTETASVSLKAESFKNIIKDAQERL